MVAPGASGVKVVRFEDGADLVGRLFEFAVATTEDERLARCGLGQSEQHAQSGRLAGAVRGLHFVRTAPTVRGTPAEWAAGATGRIACTATQRGRSSG